MSYRIPCLKSDNTTLVRNTTGGSITGTVFTLDNINDVRKGMFVIGGGISSNDNIYVASLGTSTITLSQEVTLNNAALTFCNCIIEQISQPRIVNVALGNNPDTLTLNISKAVGGLNNSDFSISASTFKVGGRTYSQNSNSLVYTHGSNSVVFPSGILKVTLADTGSPGSLTNTVTATVDLDDNYVMPNADTTLDFDLEGNCTEGATNTTSAYLHSFQPSNPDVTVTTGTGTNPAVFEDNVGTVNYINQKFYTGNAVPGTTGKIFHKIVAANSGKHFVQEPDIVISSDDENRVSYYSIVKSDRIYDSFGNLTSIKFTVNFTWQTTNTQAFHNDAANIIDHACAATPSNNNVVNNVTGNFNYFNAKAGSQRLYNILGSGSAPKFNLTITRAGDGATYDFDNAVFNSTSTSLSNVAIPSNQQGGYMFSVNYPSTTASATYNWVLTGGTNTTLGSSIPSTNPTYVVQGLQVVTQTFNFPNSVQGYTLTPNNIGLRTASDLAFSTTVTNKQPQVVVTKNGGGNITLERDPIASDWSNLTSNGFQIGDPVYTVTGNGSASVTILSSIDITEFGSANNTSELSLTNLLPTVLSGGGSTGAFQVRWYTKLSTSNTWSQITNADYQGVFSKSGFTNGATSFTFSFSDWDLAEPGAYGGVPDWIDNFGDLGLSYIFKDNNYNTISSADFGINQSASSINSVETGVELELYSHPAGGVSVSVPGGITITSNYTLDIYLEFTDVQQ